jgi:hypothetical protein
MADFQIDEICVRNARVEADKAWETSKTRRACIALATYLIAAVYMAFLGIEDFYLHALVPTGGFLLSTLSLQMIKRWWLTSVYRGQS